MMPLLALNFCDNVTVPKVLKPFFFTLLLVFMVAHSGKFFQAWYVHVR